MKNKKTIIVFSTLLAIACLFQLSFTWKTRGFESKARSFAEQRAKKFGEDKTKAMRRYIDSLGNKADFYSMGIAHFTYFECKQQEINLGLDLRGGMNVILEVDKGAIIKGLANDGNDPDLKKAIQVTNETVRDKGGDYVNLFIENFKKIAPTRKLNNLFVKGNNKAGIQATSSESQLNAELRKETDGAIDRVYEVIEKRINQANVTQPTVQKIDGGRISVELPGVDNPRRMEELVEKSANLEFYEVYGNTGKEAEASRILDALYKAAANPVPVAAVVDTAKTTSDTGKAAVADAKANDSNAKVTESKVDTNAKEEGPANLKNNPLAKILKVNSSGQGIPQGSSICTVKSADRQKLVEMLEGEQFRTILEPSVKVAFSSKPLDETPNGKVIANPEDYAVYFLKRGRDGKAALSSDEENIISDARPSSSQTGQLEVNMEMTPSAASTWAQITGDNIGKFIAIVLDDRVYSAPVVNGKISGGNSQISGNFDVKEADDLANVLKAGKLPAPARIVASEVVGPSLGAEAIAKGLNSLLAGFIAVLAFMVLYYNRAGWMAIVAVFANVFLIISILANLGAALTLPGIAGLILTVGMAVDANVLIYERIKEELRAGKSQKTAISLGFKHALSAIIDGHVTTLLAAIILMFTGAGPAYGFSIILVIGIFCSLFTALFITRLLLDRRADKGKDTAYDFSYNRNLLIGANYDFVGKRRVYFLISLPIIALGIVMFFYKGGLSTGIDFKGGNSFIVQTVAKNNYGVDDIKAKLDKNLPGSSNEVKTFGEGGKFRIVTTYFLTNDIKKENTNAKDSANKDRDHIGEKLVKSLDGIALEIKNNDPTTAILSSNKVGATVATSIRNKSIILLIIATIGMFLYIVFRFRNVAYAAGAIIATIHDIVVVLSVFMILDKWAPFPIEFDQNLIAALLTIVGYSMNDTVIVFDRIRDFLRDRHSKADEPSLINAAINQTLSRTIVSSLTVFVVVIVLFLFGGDSLKGFSLAMMVGIIIGTYSSIFIATPVVVEFASRKSKQELK